MPRTSNILCWWKSLKVICRHSPPNTLRQYFFWKSPKVWVLQLWAENWKWQLHSLLRSLTALLGYEYGIAFEKAVVGWNVRGSTHVRDVAGLHWAVYREGRVHQAGYQHPQLQYPQFQRQPHSRFQVTNTSVKISVAVKSASPSEFKTPL